MLLCKLHTKLILDIGLCKCHKHHKQGTCKILQGLGNLCVINKSWKSIYVCCNFILFLVTPSLSFFLRQVNILQSYYKWMQTYCNLWILKGFHELNFVTSHPSRETAPPVNSGKFCVNNKERRGEE